MNDSKPGSAGRHDLDRQQSRVDWTLCTKFVMGISLSKVYTQAIASVEVCDEQRSQSDTCGFDCLVCMLHGFTCSSAVCDLLHSSPCPSYPPASWSWMQPASAFCHHQTSWLPPVCPTNHCCFQSLPSVVGITKFTPHARMTGFGQAHPD